MVHHVFVPWCHQCQDKYNVYGCVPNSWCSNRIGIKVHSIFLFESSSSHASSMNTTCIVTLNNVYSQSLFLPLQQLLTQWLNHSIFCLMEWCKLELQSLQNSHAYEVGDTICVAPREKAYPLLKIFALIFLALSCNNYFLTSFHYFFEGAMHCVSRSSYEYTIYVI